MPALITNTFATLFQLHPYTHKTCTEKNTKQPFISKYIVAKTKLKSHINKTLNKYVSTALYSACSSNYQYYKPTTPRKLIYASLHSNSFNYRKTVNRVICSNLDKNTFSLSNTYNIKLLFKLTTYEIGIVSNH